MRALTLAALATFAADQALKLYIIHGLDLRNRGSVDVIDPLLNFRWAENRGVNFGLLYHDAELMRWVLIGLAVVISGWVLQWARRDGFTRWGQISAGMLVGGAAGNVVDRIAYGYVADFLNMSCCGIENPYAFNVADIGIFAGAIGLVLFTGKSQSGEAARKG
ncbi:MAG: signal peptidase II [Alphaproteobacteria bacterium]|nr:signal peptidase II [Alphaproteobacteria bacterium]